MIFGLLADLVVVVHVFFVVFAVGGGLLVLRWRKIMWAHLPAAAWAALIEFANWVCPLTPLENWLRRLAGAEGYAEGFIERYLLPVLYPGGLTRPIQIALGVGVVVVNLVIYAWLLGRARARR